MTTLKSVGLVKVEVLDLVGYKGDGVFVILNPVKHAGRQLPAEIDGLPGCPMCIPAHIPDGQVVNFSGEDHTLHNIDGKWCCKPKEGGVDSLSELTPHTFFEVGSIK